jgi:hypothetical protein
MILAQRIPLEGVRPLDAGCGSQFRWADPLWEHGFYRVYYDGKLIAVQKDNYFNSFLKEHPSPKLVEIFAEVKDVPN